MRINRPRNGSGWLVVFKGSMYSSKTEAAISLAEKAEKYGNKEVLAFKPRSDTRSGTGALRSHDERTWPAIDIMDSKPTSILPYVKDSTDIVVIEEAHLFDSSLVDVVKTLVREMKKLVVVVGLGTDFYGKAFRGMADLLALADEIEVHYAYCYKCGEPNATLSQLLIDGKPASEGLSVKHVGGEKEGYVAACGKCFVF